MKLISIDTETTGLNFEEDQLLSIAAVMVDTKAEMIGPHINIFIPHERISGNPFALNMNKDLIELNVIYKNYGPIKFLNATGFTHIYDESDKLCWFFDTITNDVKASALDVEFHKFVESDTFTALGKNFPVFDKPFINHHTTLFNVSKPDRRTADPAVLWVRPDDKKLPNLETCMKRAGIETPLTHDALQDAMDTAEVYLKALKRL